jgi:ferredoxin-NADP reductase
MTIDMRLTAIRYAAQDTNLYEFRRADGAALEPVEPGAHIDLNLPNGMVRSYSLVTADGDRSAYVVGIKRDRASRGGSVFVHDNLRVGQMVAIGGPRNNFPLKEDAAHSVLIAGGIGITPIWCMAQRLKKLGRSFELHYACRDRAEVAFADELKALPEAKIHVDTEAGGFLDVGAIVAGARKDAHFYCCGPIPMLEGYERATKDVPAEQVHVEYFSSKEAAATEGGYVVELRKSGKEYMIPEGRTILEVLVEDGVDIMYSCQEGVCGACETIVVSGTPDHRDGILTDAERVASKTMMICCSGSKSPRLVLDL